MAGRAPVKIYEYSPEGKYIGRFDTMSECRQTHFSDVRGVQPILRFKRMGIRYGKTRGNNFLFAERVYRDRVRFLKRVEESEFCSDTITSRHRLIQMFNLEGVLLLEARNLNILTKLTGFSATTILHQLERGGDISSKSSGFFYRYKEENIQI